MAIKRKAGKKGAAKAEEKDEAPPSTQAKKADTPPKEEPKEEEEEASDSEGDDDEGSEESEEDEDVGEKAAAVEEAVAEGAIVASEGAAAPAKGTKKRKTKAHRLEEAQARVDAEGGDKDDDPEPKGVMYLGHIPEGFAEPQMRSYFNQFGTVLRLRLSRSKRTARSKGYAFVEFEEEAVAKIVAQTMNGYLMFGKKLVCHMVPKERQHPALWKGWNKRMVNQQPERRKKARESYNDRPTVEVEGVQIKRSTRNQVQKRARANHKLAGLLQQLEIDYDISGFDVPKDILASAKIKQASSPVLKAASSPKLKSSGSPKLSPKVKPVPQPAASTKPSVADIMEKAAAAAEEEGTGAAEPDKGKKRKAKAAEATAEASGEAEASSDIKASKGKKKKKAKVA